MHEVLILGGYGNFGKRIATALSRHTVPVVIAGRNPAKAEALSAELPGARAAAIDIHRDFAAALTREQPSVVVHTCGPFQGADYDVARACIAAGVHYVDLADGRDFVTGFRRLDADARAAGVTAVSGASTVPGLSSAVVEHFKGQFSRLDAMDFGIAPGQRAERGLATTQGILSYAGRRLEPFAGHPAPYGWQDLRRLKLPGMGTRWLANCDIPDLDLLPETYGLQDIRFGAGLEVGGLHFGLWALSWAVRLGLPLNLKSLARPMLAISNVFDPLGSDIGGMFVDLTGLDHEGRPKAVRWAIVAGSGDGPQIPCAPAILLAKRLHEKSPGMAAGALPCVGLISLENYLAELERFDIKTF
jgi:hypothetical protein